MRGREGSRERCGRRERVVGREVAGELVGGREGSRGRCGREGGNMREETGEENLIIGGRLGAMSTNTGTHGTCIER